MSEGRITLPEIVRPEVDAALDDKLPAALAELKGLVRIASITTSSSGGAEVDGVPALYRDLVISLRAVGTTALSASSLRFNDDTGDNYRWQRLYQIDDDPVVPEADHAANLIRTGFVRDRIIGQATIFGYASSAPKLVMGEQWTHRSDGDHEMGWSSFRGVWLDSSAVTKVRWAGTFESGVRMDVFGRG